MEQSQLNIKLLVGLANPGDEYAQTRHNAGAWLCQRLATKENTSFKNEKKCFATIAKIPSQKLLIAIPNTYMNESGKAVAKLLNYYQLMPEQLLVIHDELDLPPGQAQLKWAGGHAGHNGLRDIFNAVGSRDFLRLRLGIGKPTHKSQTSDFVLSAPLKQQQRLIDNAIDNSLRILPKLTDNNLELAKQILHT